MDPQEAGEENFISKNRLETLVDGIFAFAMTLLVLSLTVPEISSAEAVQKLPSVLAGMWPAFFSFIIAFLVLAGFWMSHHRFFLVMKTIDKNILWLNLVTLMGIVFVPFTTNLAGDYSDVPIAVELFHLNLLFIGALFYIQWRYIHRHPALSVRQLTDTEIRCWSTRALIIPVMAIVGLVLTPFIYGWSMAIYMASRIGAYVVERWCK